MMISQLLLLLLLVLLTMRSPNSNLMLALGKNVGDYRNLIDDVNLQNEMASIVDFCYGTNLRIPMDRICASLEHGEQPPMLCLSPLNYRQLPPPSAAAAVTTDDDYWYLSEAC